MSVFALPLTRRILRVGLLGALLGWGGSATAGAIPFDAYLQFSFTDAGTPAAGCDPEDPAGLFCIPSSGTATLFLDAPPWTFLADFAGATLTVVDAFTSGDRFEIFDFGVSIGLSSLPGAGADCGDDPVVCLADPNFSQLVVLLGPGSHSLSIIPVLVPEFGGTGYLQVTGTPGTTPVPEPSPWSLVALALVTLGADRILRPSRRLP